VQSLVDDLADRYVELFASFSGEVKVSAYDVEGSKPVYSAAEAIRRVGAIGSANSPRELAVCLSFYGERNLPRTRGRLYLPASFLNIGVNVTRPAMPITKMADIVNVFQDLGGANVDWSIWSPTSQDVHKVEHWWYDNEWDVQRSRGLRATQRITGTTSE
jgi:hypothetical protein